MNSFTRTCLSLAVLAVFQSTYAHATTYNTIQGIDAGSTITNDIDVSVNKGTFTPGSSGGLPDLNVGGLYINYRNQNYTNPTTFDGKVTINLQGEYAKDNRPYWGDTFSGINVAKAQGKHPQSEVTFGKQVLINLDIDLKNNTESSLAGINTDNGVDITFKEQVSINLNKGTKVYGTNTVAGVYVSNDTITFNNGLEINSAVNDLSDGKAQISGLLLNTQGNIKVSGLTKITGVFGNPLSGSGYASALNLSCDGGNDALMKLQAVEYQGGLSNSAISIIGSLAVLKLTDDNSNYHSIIEGTTHFYTGTLDLTFQQPESYYRSNIIRHDEWGTKKDIFLTFANGAKWYVIDKSDWVNKLNLTDGGEVIFEGIKSADPTQVDNSFQRIETDQFISSNKDNRGIIHFNVDVAANKSDQLIITKQETNSTNYLTASINWKGVDSNALYMTNPLIEQNDGSLTVVNKDGENIYHRNGGVVPWHVSFVKDGSTVDFDDTDFRNDITLNTGTGKGKWYLVREDEIIDPTPDPDPNPDPKPEQPKPNDPAEMQQITNLGISATQALSFASELEDLRGRLGEVRYGAQDGAWVRAGYAKETADGYNGRGFEQKTHDLHIGLDRIVVADEDSSWLVGGALRYAKSKQEGFTAARGGEGELEQYSAKLYATYMHAQGSYADFVVQAGRYSQDLTGLANDLSSAFKADYKTYGYGASVEIGHVFDFNNQVDDRQWFNHFFIEPQLQLSYFNAHGKDYKTSTGLAVSQSDADFLTGRAGVVVGKKFNYGTADDLDKRYFQVGLKGGVKYEFLGDQTIRFTGIEGITKERKADDVDGARYYYGVTADWQLSNNFRAYATVEREEGDHYTKDFDVSVGVKYQF